MTEEIGGEDGVTPGGKMDADFLKEPTGVGAIAVGHVDGAFDFMRLEIEREKGLGEDFAIGSLEM